jgi:hypothetical protein
MTLFVLYPVNIVLTNDTSQHVLVRLKEVGFTYKDPGYILDCVDLPVKLADFLSAPQKISSYRRGMSS